MVQWKITSLGKKALLVGSFMGGFFQICSPDFNHGLPYTDSPQPETICVLIYHYPVIPHIPSSFKNSWNILHDDLTYISFVCKGECL